VYKCISAQGGDPILILAPHWRSRIAELRSLDRQDQFLCQGCRQPVRVRAGRTRRWHFAHKHLQNCPFETASPSLLEARAVLYDWLVSQFDPQTVDLEVSVPGVDLPRPLDAWVAQDEGRFAYWIVGARMQPQVRQQLQHAIARLGIPVNLLFLHTMLHFDLQQPNVALLTTTEREFASRSPFDQLVGDITRPTGASLHYLEPKSRRLVTLRSLICVHRPQSFQASVLESDLGQVSATPERGEPAHPEELPRLVSLQRKQSHRREKVETARSKLGGALQRMLPDSLSTPAAAPVPIYERKPVLPEELFADLAECVFCGQITRDWWYLDKASGKCKCRSCLRLGRS
jgi:hypothetical protein